MLVEAVIYVDVGGTERNARTLEREIRGQPTRLVVKFGAGLLVLSAHRSEGREAGTWHRPARPS